MLTLLAASSAADATVMDSLAVCVALAVMVRAVVCSSVAEDETWPTMLPIAASKLSAIWCKPVLRSFAAAWRASSASTSSARVRFRLSLNT